MRGAGFAGCFEMMLAGTLCMVCIVVRSRTEVRSGEGDIFGAVSGALFCGWGDFGDESVC